MKELLGKTKWIFVLLFACAIVALPGCAGAQNQKDDDVKENTLQEAPKEEIVVIHEDAGLLNGETYEKSVHLENEEERDEIGESNDLSGNEVDEMNDFYISEIDDEIFARIKGKSYKDDCTVPVEELRYVHVLHIDFDGNTKEGEIIVNAAIAEDILEIFRELYELSYPIEKIKLVDEYDADDEQSMADNNSSSFNFRTVSGTTKLSNHAKGMAIDINPLYNPYIHGSSGQIVEPANAGEYVDRDRDFPHKIDKDDDAYKVFVAHGFSWGGDWKNSKDYQHFEK